MNAEHLIKFAWENTPISYLRICVDRILSFQHPIQLMCSLLPLIPTLTIDLQKEAKYGKCERFSASLFGDIIQNPPKTIVKILLLH